MIGSGCRWTVSSQSRVSQLCPGRRAGLLALLLLAQTGELCPAEAAADARHVPAQDDAWSELRQKDLRLATYVYRLSVANASLCSDRMPQTGLVLQSVDEFDPAIRADATRSFGFYAPISVEGVIAGSPADIAGVKPNDGILEINDHKVGEGETSSRPTIAKRDSANAFMEALPPVSPINLTLRDHEHGFVARMQPVAGCRVRAELLMNDNATALSDDQTIQIGAAFFDRLDDASLAVVLAHEMAHQVLKHGALMESKGVHRGFLGEFGKSSRLVRETEDQADRYSIHLLANAGFDPEIGPKFWRGSGRALDHGILRSATHSPSTERAANMEDEIRKLANRPAIDLHHDAAQ